MSDLTVRCPVGSLGACYYTAASASGTAVNATSTLTFSAINIGVVHPTTDSIGPSCGATAQLGVRLDHLVQGGTNRTITLGTS